MFETELKNLTIPNKNYHELALDRQSILTKPRGSLGRLEEVACFMATWQETERPNRIKHRFWFLLEIMVHVIRE